jgi:hypothetical protein
VGLPLCAVTQLVGILVVRLRSTVVYNGPFPSLDHVSFTRHFLSLSLRLNMLLGEEMFGVFA